MSEQTAIDRERRDPADVVIAELRRPPIPPMRPWRPTTFDTAQIDVAIREDRQAFFRRTDGT